MPTVSVIIPNYNHAPYLPQRIESVLNQTWEDFEVILLDDCSPDNSRAIIADYAARDARIQFVANTQNSGSTFKQWNKGIALAKGDYVWLAESDDYAQPTFLAQAIQKFASDPAIGLVYAASQAVDEQGNMLPLLDDFYDDLDKDLWQHDFVLDGIELVTKFMSYKNIIPNASAVVIRRDILLQVGPANENFKLNGDWVFWAAILSRTKVAYIADKLNYFRFHINNVRSKTHHNGTAINEAAKVVYSMRQYGQPNPFFLDKSINFLIGMWLGVMFKTSISWQLQQELYTNIKNITPDFHSRFAKSFARLMLNNNLNSMRRLLGNGLVYRYLKNRKK